MCQQQATLQTVVTAAVLQFISNAPEGNTTYFQRDNTTTKSLQRSAGAQKRLFRWNTANRQSAAVWAQVPSNISAIMFSREREAQVPLHRAHHGFPHYCDQIKVGSCCCLLETHRFTIGQERSGKPFQDLMKSRLHKGVFGGSFQRMEDAWRDLERADIRLSTCWHLNNIY